MSPNLIFLQGLKLLRQEHGVQTKDKRLVIDKFYLIDFNNSKNNLNKQKFKNLLFGVDGQFSQKDLNFGIIFTQGW